MGNTALEEHLGYLADPVRHAALRAAVTQLVNPGDRVADLGCGSGVLGLLCLRQGAAFVEAIDDTAILEVARRTLQREGHAERVRLHACSTWRAALAAPVDLLVCDHVGYFGIDYGLLELLADARQRFLKPGGRILPRRVQLLVGAVHSDAGREQAEAWASAQVDPAYHWLRGHGINAKHALTLQPDELLSGLAPLADLETGLDYPATLRWQTTLTVQRAGLLDGLVGCFRAELAEGIWMSNSPLAEDAIARPQAFLPIDARLPVAAGDTLRIAITQNPTKNLIAWQVEHAASGRRFSHSTFAGELLTPAELAQQRPDRQPRLGALGRARNTVLTYADGVRTAAEIEAAVLREHPDLLPSEHAIRRFVAATLVRDTE